MGDRIYVIVQTIIIVKREEDEILWDCIVFVCDDGEKANKNARS